MKNAIRWRIGILALLVFLVGCQAKQVTVQTEQGWMDYTMLRGETREKVEKILQKQEITLLPVSGVTWKVDDQESIGDQLLDVYLYFDTDLEDENFVGFQKSFQGKDEEENRVFVVDIHQLLTEVYGEPTARFATHYGEVNDWEGFFARIGTDVVDAYDNGIECWTAQFRWDDVGLYSQVIIRNDEERSLTIDIICMDMEAYRQLFPSMGNKP